MTNLHESYFAGFGFDIANPGLKTDYRSAVLPTALPGPANMHAFMYMCVRAQVCACACMCVHVCMRATDGQRVEAWVDLNVSMCVHACAFVRPCLRACDPVCKDGLI